MVNPPNVFAWVVCVHICLRGVGADGLGEGLVDFEDGAFGAVVAGELGLVLALYDGEGVHNVGAL